MTYTLKIVSDFNAENPRESRDGMIPLYTDWWREYGEHSYWFDFIELCKSKLNRKNAYKILEMIGYTKKESMQEIKDYWYYDCIEFAIEKLDNENLYIQDMNNILVLLWYNTCFHKSRGYSRWDYVECLFVSENKKYDFKNDCTLYDSRARWDVYGYQVIEHKPLYNIEWSLSSITDDAIIDSCYWYYGNDWINDIFEQVKNYWITVEQFENAKQNIIY